MSGAGSILWRICDVVAGWFNHSSAPLFIMDAPAKNTRKHPARNLSQNLDFRIFNARSPIFQVPVGTKDTYKVKRLIARRKFAKVRWNSSVYSYYVRARLKYLYNSIMDFNHWLNIENSEFHALPWVLKNWSTYSTISHRYPWFSRIRCTLTTVND